MVSATEVCIVIIIIIIISIAANSLPKLSNYGIAIISLQRG
jgi:hypothetical protein